MRAYLSIEASLATVIGALDPLELAIRLPVLLLALTVHEFSHAYTAYRLGDPTAYRLGRCSLNPLVHLDPLGALCLLFAPIGWAKPVPVNPLNLTRPDRDFILISAAGPASNLVQALLYAIFLRWVGAYAPSIRDALGDPGLRAAALFGFAGVIINAGLAVFNMIPAYPLDGFHVFSNLAKGRSQERFREMAPYGPFIIIGLVLLGNTSFDPLGLVIDPVHGFFLSRVAGRDAIAVLLWALQKA
jgi:Zn-dependent protease